MAERKFHSCCAGSENHNFSRYDLATICMRWKIYPVATSSGTNAIGKAPSGTLFSDRRQFRTGLMIAG